MSTRLTSPVSSSPANAAGIAAAMALLASEASAAVQIFVPNPAPYEGAYAGVYVHHIDVAGATIGPGFESGLLLCLSSSLQGTSGIITSMDSAREYIFDAYSVNRGCYTSNHPTFLSEGDLVSADTASFVGGLSFDFVGNSYTAGDVFYLGYGFRDKGSSDLYNYGWMELSFAENGNVSVYRWAYEDVAGASTVIPGAAVPEPAHAALVLGGIGLLVAARKRLRQPRRS
ncbi:MAG: PEP-CTERM sorting domain-containing protein [Verrucomicrobiota bacterium JB022]|nr:PEP-CTERM sorting domain-containing protein [Verrucomicrobiota bacterium JB022]